MYVDNDQRDLIADIKDKDGNTVKNIHVMTYDEALSITGSTLLTTGLRNTGSNYWLANADAESKYDVYTVYHTGSIEKGFQKCIGIRPVVTLKSGVYIERGSGVEGDPYVLGIEQ